MQIKIQPPCEEKESAGSLVSLVLTSFTLRPAWRLKTSKIPLKANRCRLPTTCHFKTSSKFQPQRPQRLNCAKNLSLLWTILGPGCEICRRCGQIAIYTKGWFEDSLAKKRVRHFSAPYSTLHRKSPRVLLTKFLVMLHESSSIHISLAFLLICQAKVRLGTAVALTPFYTAVRPLFGSYSLQSVFCAAFHWQRPPLSSSNLTGSHQDRLDLFSIISCMT